MDYLTSEFPNIFPAMKPRGNSVYSKVSSLSAKSIITDLDTIGVAGKKIEDTMKLSHVVDLVRFFQVNLKRRCFEKRTGDILTSRNTNPLM